MRRLYFFLADNLPYISLLLVLGLIPDLLLQGWIPAVHAAIVAFVVVILLAGMILGYDDSDEKCHHYCSYCIPKPQLPDPKSFDGFVVHDNAIWMIGSDGEWVGTDIHYCPMCGRELEDYDVKRQSGAND